ncbi:MAG: 50S ribosomal protein L5 [Patescibacteria group bacterium]
MSMLEQKYHKIVLPELKKKFAHSSNMASPRITKVVINTGFGRRTKEEQTRIKNTLSRIAGQLVADRQSRKSMASFKTRQGQIIGASATLRGERMYSFLAKLFFVALPRTRDFRGINEESLDSGGNLTIGIKEHIVFPEAASEDARSIFGFEVTIVARAKSKTEALELFKLLGVPFKKK